MQTKQDLRLTLENPEWRDSVMASAKECLAQGNLNEYMEANNFEPKVVEYINLHLYA